MVKPLFPRSFTNIFFGAFMASSLEVLLNNLAKQREISIGILLSNASFFPIATFIAAALVVLGPSIMWSRRGAAVGPDGQELFLPLRPEVLLHGQGPRPDNRRFLLTNIRFGFCIKHGDFFRVQDSCGGARVSPRCCPDRLFAYPKTSSRCGLLAPVFFGMETSI